MAAAAPPQAKAAVRDKATPPPAAGEKLEGSIPGLLEEGERFLEARRYEEASQTFSQVLKLLRPGDPDRPRALLDLARAQEGQKDFTTAIQTYRELAQESPAHRDLAEQKIKELSAEVK
jgi:cytochrome c-type biogenesis protein CcmH/NrfG